MIIIMIIIILNNNYNEVIIMKITFVSEHITIVVMRSHTKSALGPSMINEDKFKKGVEIIITTTL